MLRICLVRHGETAWNAERRLQGQLDVPLSANGEAQAGRLANFLALTPFDAVYSSDLGRAMATVRAVASRQGLAVRPLPGLRERHYGHFQSLTQDEAALKHPEGYARFKARDEHYDFAEGESLRVLASRVRATLQTLAACHDGQCLLVATHGGVLDIVQRMASGQPLKAARNFDIPNTGVNWLTHEAGHWQIETWGRTDHLDEAGLDEVAR